MYTKTIILLIALGSCIQVDEFQNANKRFTQINQSGPIGKFWMDLAQLHSQVSGPLDDLKETLDTFYEKLQSSLDQLDAEYSKKRALHDKTLQAYTLNQQDAQIDIAQSQDQFDNVLVPNKENLNKRLDQIKQNLNDNQNNLQRDKVEREKEQKMNIENIHEHQLAVTAIDEALQLVAGLSNGNIQFSEAPLKKTLTYIKSKVDSKEEFAPMIEALVNLSGSQDTKQIRDLLNKLRNAVVDSQNSLTAEENNAKKMFDERQKQLSTEYSGFQTQINQATYDLTSIMARMDQEKEFLKNRKNDLSQYEEQIQMENDNFASITGLYNDIRGQRLKEIKIVEDAKNFSYSAQFRELIQSKVNK